MNIYRGGNKVLLCGGTDFMLIFQSSGYTLADIAFVGKPVEKPERWMDG
ncbi:hypothetical protein J4732_22155 [Serratia marcescens]|uniref:Uncharacterized protein n=1 Tax=Serratia marcescens TaxID=615 RepID=A0A939NQZ9_SERMA|nr:hypothetical protein [Serratia marcescens]